MENNSREDSLILAIRAQAREKLNRLQEDYDVRRREIIDGYRQEATEEASVFIEQALSELKTELMQSESLAKWKVKKDLFIRRQALVDALFNEVKADLIAFSKTPDYAELMKTRLKEAKKLIGEGKCSIVVKPDDVTLFGALATPQCVEGSDQIHLGGFVMRDPGGKVQIDETLDYALKSQHEWFTSHSGLDF